MAVLILLMKDKLYHMLFLTEVHLIVVKRRKADSSKQHTDILKPVMMVSDKIRWHLAVVGDWDDFGGLDFFD